MKFTDGNWLVQPGYELIRPVQAYDVRTDTDSITVYASPRDLKSRRGKLDMPLLTVRYSSPIENVIKVQIYRHKGAKPRKPEFKIYETNEYPVQIHQTDAEATLTTGDLSVKIDKQNQWQVRFFDHGRYITGSGFKGMAHITTPDQGTFMREQLDVKPGEYVYGLGERFTPFVKNGQVVEIWNRDGGTSTEQAYKNVPFYLSNKGYGVFVNHPENVSFEVASEIVSKVQFSVEGEYLEYFIIGGSSPKKVLENYSALTGKPSLPPAWSFGLWLTTSFTTDYDEKTVNHFVEGMKERDIPLHVFHFDCFWMKAFHWCDFEWD